MENNDQENLEAEKTKEVKKAKKINEKVDDVVGFDPKNREVILSHKGGKFFVRKEATGFQSKGLGLVKAKDVFELQISCSQN